MGKIMKLKVGKKYETKNGAVYEVIHIVNNPLVLYPVVAIAVESCIIKSFTREGIYDINALLLIEGVAIDYTHVTAEDDGTKVFHTKEGCYRVTDEELGKREDFKENLIREHIEPPLLYCGYTEEQWDAIKEEHE